MHRPPHIEGQLDLFIPEEELPKHKPVDVKPEPTPIVEPDPNQTEIKLTTPSNEIITSNADDVDDERPDVWAETGYTRNWNKKP